MYSVSLAFVKALLSGDSDEDGLELYEPKVFDS